MSMVDPRAHSGSLGFPGRPNEPFLWGGGGKRMTPEDITFQRRLAAQQMAQGADFSPVQHWTQGAARAATGLLGGLHMHKADEAAEARTGEIDSIAQILMAGGQMPDGSDPVAAALAFPELQDIAELTYKQRNPAPVEPTIQRANNGDILGLNPMTGEVMFQHADPNPKPALDWLSVKNPDGTTTLVPVGVGGPMAGQSGSTPPATLPPDFDFGEGGPTQPASETFSAGFRGLPGETVTSTFRTPAHNREVGGVPNSFHTRRDGRGNPMARDSVPPPGMGMAEYYRQLKAANPHLEVINEGDHVHMEPR